jgi:hypothetical protein
VLAVELEFAKNSVETWCLGEPDLSDDLYDQTISYALFDQTFLTTCTPGLLLTPYLTRPVITTYLLDLSMTMPLREIW